MEMKIDELIKRIRASTEQRIKLSESKGHDYATDADTLHNFKVQAKLTGQNPSQCAASLVMVKAVRLGNLMFGGKEPKHESIEDTVLDMQNYLDLMMACMEEEEVKVCGETTDSLCVSCCNQTDMTHDSAEECRECDNGSSYRECR